MPRRHCGIDRDAVTAFKIIVNQSMSRQSSASEYVRAELKNAKTALTNLAVALNWVYTAILEEKRS